MLMLPRKLLIWGGTAAIAAGGFAFMASNSLGTSNAGEGAAAVTGYTVSNITYSGISTKGGGQAGTMQWNGNAGPVATINGKNIYGDGIVTTVSFTLNPDNALWSQVQLYDSNGNVIGGGGATNCTETAGTWTCNITGDTGYNGGGAWSNSSGTPLYQIAYVEVGATH